MRRAASFLGVLGLALASHAGSGTGAERVHEVKAGETLWQIAAVLTGDPHRWPELYRANRDQIRDPSTLYPGQRLAIPDFEAASRARSRDGVAEEDALYRR